MISLIMNSNRTRLIDRQHRIAAFDVTEVQSRHDRGKARFQPDRASERTERYQFFRGNEEEVMPGGWRLAIGSRREKIDGMTITEVSTRIEPAGPYLETK